MGELGYVYNRGAASLRSQVADTVGVVITNVANPFFGELLRGLESELTRSSLSCLIVNTGQDPQAQSAAITEFREHQVAGVAIVPASGSTPALVDQLRVSRLPHVFMTRYVKDAPTHYVGADDRLGGYLATRHLLDHGAGSLAYLGGPAAVQSRWDRLDGVRKALDERGRDYGMVVADQPGDSSGAGGLSTADQLLRAGPLPDALICHSDLVAFGAFRALRRAGCSRLPLIVGYDNIPVASLWEPPLTTVSTKAETLGRLAARNLLQQLEGENDHEVLTTVTAPVLVVRESCGCPRAPDPAARRGHESRCT
jgi:LacI family transcriptional regulator